MATPLSFDLNQVLVDEKPRLRKIILNRPQQLNCLTYEMITQLKRNLERYEIDDTIRLVILTGQGKAFCAGGDVVRFMQVTTAGHWSFAAIYYKKQLELDYLIATYKKPMVMLINGAVMGGGAGLSMNVSSRVVTENTVFAMPEVSIGHYPDVGASYFLSRLTGYFGEYLGLTGARISGAEMLECGLATNFVFSKDLRPLENELNEVVNISSSAIPKALEKFSHKPSLKQDSACRRMDIIKKCFSRNTVEDILSSLETEVLSCGDKWIINAIKSMKSASPTSLKICLKAIREGRSLTLRECLSRDYCISAHLLRKTFHNDFFEGARAVFIDKDKSPKWDPKELEQVNEKMVQQFFTEMDDSDWERLQLPDRETTTINKNSKL